MRIRTTVASVSAGICRTASWEGTREPTPRTWRSIGPRFTESVHTVPRSTVGAAGRSRYTAIVTAAITTMTTADTAICRLRFCCLNSGRAISITPSSGKFRATRSEEHTSELQSLRHLVCRLLLEKKKKKKQLKSTEVLYRRTHTNTMYDHHH